MKDKPRGNAACSVASATSRPRSQYLSWSGANGWELRILRMPVPGLMEHVIANFICQLDRANRAQTLRSVF